MIAQLECKLCKTKRELTDEEIKESMAIISRKNLKQDSIPDILNLFDGENCAEGGMHEYEVNKDYLMKMLDDASKIRANNAEIVRKTNENKELESKIEQFKKDMDIKIKEMMEKINKNKESNILMEKINTEGKDNILKTSGREWNSWL